MNITLAQAQQALEAALEKATELKVKMNVAIVDSGANLVAFAREDGAWLGSRDIAEKKARTAIFFQMPSSAIGKLSQPGESLYMIEVSNGGLVSFGGGFPIQNEQKEFIGAIGVSGGVVKQDEEVAKAGLRRLATKRSTAIIVAMANSTTSNAALRAKFAAFGRPSWKPVIADGDGALNGSKYAGIPLLQNGEDWPKCTACGAAQQLFLQLNISKLPQGAQELLGMNAGLLQMFYCTVCEGDGESWAPFAPSHLLRIIADSGSDIMPALPEEFGTRSETYFPAKTITGWTPFEDFPNLEEDIDLPELSDEEFDAYYVSEPYLNADGDKLGGWPAWVQSEEYPQCPECGTQMHAVYQLDSNDGVPWMWGDVGIGHITQCANHRHLLAFGWACS